MMVGGSAVAVAVHMALLGGRGGEQGVCECAWVGEEGGLRWL